MAYELFLLGVGVVFILLRVCQEKGSAEKSEGNSSEPSLSQSPDLPPPHGLAPSETMVSDHGLGPPLSTENPRNKGFSGSGAPIFGFGLAGPAPKG